MKQSYFRLPATSNDKHRATLTTRMKRFSRRCEFLMTLFLAGVLISITLEFVHQQRIFMEQKTRREQSSASLQRPKGQNRSETAIEWSETSNKLSPIETSNKLGQGQSEISNKLGQIETSNKLGQGHNETTNKLGQGQSVTTNKLDQGDIMVKLIEEEEFFAVFEEPQERLLRMEINCTNLQKQEEHRYQWMRNILVDDDRKFLYCAVVKTGSRNLDRSLIETSRTNKELNNRLKEFIIKEKYSSETAFTQYEEFLKLLEEVSPPSDMQYKLDSYFKVLVVRDPWIRLHRTFRDKFQKKNSSVPNYYGRHILERYRENATAQELQTGSGVTFAEFLQFVVDEGRYGLISKNWMSIHDMCHPCLVKYNYIAKIETINPEFTDSITDSKSSDIFQRYYSSIPSKTLDGIRELYALDFELFGYDRNEV